MTIVKATVKGQILIPAPIRKKLSIVRGTQLHIYEKANRILVEPVQSDAVETDFNKYSLAWQNKPRH